MSINEKGIITENIILYQTWEALQDFMMEVKKSYESAGLNTKHASSMAVEWANRIWSDPSNLKTVREEWESTRIELQHAKVYEETTYLLEQSGIPTVDAKSYARTYIRDLDKLGIITSKDERVQQLQKNLNALIAEYQLRKRGQDYGSDYPLPKAVEFPTLYVVSDVYDYIIDSALRGEWFPFATYVASQHGSKVNVKKFDMSQEDFIKAMSFDRVQGKILWNNIFTVVGIASLATVIFNGLVKLFQWYYYRENTFAIQVKSQSTENIPMLWEVIKKSLGINAWRIYDLKSPKVTEMLVKSSEPVLLDSELNKTLKTLSKSLKQNHFNVRVTLSKKQDMWPTFQILEV